MHWIYVFQCIDNHIYVGETTKLSQRWTEHLSGQGSTNTAIHKPQKLLGLYNVSHNLAFIKYCTKIDEPFLNTSLNEKWDSMCYKDNHSLHCECINIDFTGKHFETFITERYMIEFNEKWNTIHGGKYIHFAIKEKPKELENYIKDRPLCKCMRPCEIKKYENKLYFVCSLNDIEIIYKHEHLECFDTIEKQQPCDFCEDYNMIEIKSIINKTSSLNKKVKLLHNEEFVKMLDKHSYKICFNNGIYDLESNEFKTIHNDIILMNTNTNYTEFDSNSDVGKEILKFFNDLFPNEDIKNYILDVLAKCLDNEIIKNKCLNVWNGPAEVGKRLLIELIKQSFGDYACETDISLLDYYWNTPEKNSKILQLKGKRCCVVCESGKTMKAIKSLMNNDIPIRRLDYKLFVLTNKLPVLDNADDPAEWREIIIVDFVNDFTEYQSNNLLLRFKYWSGPFMAMLIKRYNKKI